MFLYLKFSQLNKDTFHCVLDLKDELSLVRICQSTSRNVANIGGGGGGGGIGGQMNQLALQIAGSLWMNVLFNG